MKKSNAKDAFKWAITIVSLSVVIVALAYYINFRNAPISQDPAAWGAFADYFGGVLNPLIAIGNLFLLIFISFQLADRDDIRDRKVLQHQAFQEFVNMLDEVQELTPPVERENIFELGAIKNSYVKWINANRHLFPRMVGPQFLSLHLNFYDLIDAGQEYYLARKRAGDSWPLSADVSAQEKIISDKYSEFYAKRRSLEDLMREHLSE